MSGVILVCSEPIADCIAGIGLRYVEFCRELSRRGLNVSLLSPAPEGLSTQQDLGGARYYEFSASRLHTLAQSHACVVAQGHLATAVCRLLPSMPKAIDLYDPYLVEHLAYAESLGEGVFRHDLDGWVEQFQQGDVFLCSGDEQRLYYAGFLTALGRINPRLAAQDSSLKDLLLVVPFGVPEKFPEHRAVLPANDRKRARYLFGCLYDWYDPWTALNALESSGLDWELYFVVTPNSGTTPQSLVNEVSQYASNKGWLSDRVHFIQWQRPERRFDLLYDVDGMVVTHRSSLETDLSLRTRLLEALAVGCPVFATQGGTLARQMVEAGAAEIVAPGDHASLAQSFVALREDQPRRKAMLEAGRGLASQYRWSRTVEPLVRFCDNPAPDPHKFAFYRGLSASLSAGASKLPHHRAPGRAPGQASIIEREPGQATMRDPGGLEAGGLKSGGLKSGQASMPAFGRSTETDSAPPSEPEISIIIPTYNRPHLLAEILRALANQLGAPPFEVVVVDDGSDSETQQLLESWDFSMPHQLHRQENSGPAAARNLGLASARGAWVAFLGDDTVPAPDWLARHRAAHRRLGDAENVAVVGRTDWHPRIAVTPFMRFINEYGSQFGYGLIDDESEVDFRFFYTSNLSLKRSLLDPTGFREDFPYAAWEDIEAGYRLQKNGASLHYEPAARVNHDHPSSIESFCERQQRAGVAAVVFYGLHPELGPMLQLGPAGPPPLPPAQEIANRLRHAQITQYQPFYLVELWESALNDSYLQGLHLGWNQFAPA